MSISNIIFIVTLVICFLSVGYLLFAIIVVERFNLKRKLLDKPNAFHPAVTVLKPIYGLDPEMMQNLVSFCQQDYPEYQIIFGLQDEQDPALPIIQQLRKQFQNIDFTYIVDTKRYGSNHKVSNLLNMMPIAKHDYLVIADSDMRVPTNYLANIIAPFEDQEIGAVTCLYAGCARGKLVSTLNAMLINEWFLPSVLISRSLQPIRYCLGATMAVRQPLLNKIGGFQILVNYLADDYMLGNRVSAHGYKVHLSDFVVTNIVEEQSLSTLIKHELRWARTLKTVEPIGFMLTFLTDTLVINSFACIVIYLLSSQFFWAVLPLFISLSLRLFLHQRIKKIMDVSHAGSFWLIPIRDILSFLIRILSFMGNTVQWRNNSYRVDTAGLIHSEQTLQVKTETISDLTTSKDY